MNIKRIALLLTCVIIFLSLSPVCYAQNDIKSYYIKSSLKDIISLIIREYVEPVKEESLLKGAIEEMKKVDRTIPADSCQSWEAFEAAFDRAYRQNPSLSSKLGEAAIKGMVRSLGDPYSLFMDPQEWDYYRRAMTGGTFAGIGVELAVKDGSLIITSPLIGSPAEKAGILPGDEIIKINGQSIVGRDFYEVSKCFDGPTGSPIALTLKRGKDRLDLRIIRQNISFEPVKAKIIGTSPPIGYIRIPLFGPTTDKEVKKALEIMKGKGITLLILDLRNNPGGDFNTALKTSAFFVSGTPLVKVYRKGGHLEDKCADSSCDFSFRIAILINEGSASAAEVISCALSDNKKAVLIGTTSFGKAVVQSVFSLPGNAALKLTTSRYLTPGGIDINHKGLKPLIVVKTVYPVPEVSKDPCVIKAVEYLKK